MTKFWFAAPLHLFQRRWYRSLSLSLFIGWVLFSFPLSFLLHEMVHSFLALSISYSPIWFLRNDRKLDEKNFIVVVVDWFCCDVRVNQWIIFLALGFVWFLRKPKKKIKFFIFVFLLNFSKLMQPGTILWIFFKKNMIPRFNFLFLF